MNKKKKVMRYVFLISMLIFSVVGKAQNMRSLFVNMPDSVCPLLTEVNRADFGDFLDSGMKAVVKNRFGKVSEMKTMTDDYIRLSLTSINDWEMKLLPLNDTVSVICVVKTFLSPARDSSIEFYDSKWNRLNREDFISIPEEKEFYGDSLSVEQADSLQSLKESIGMALVEMKLSADSKTLVLSCSSSDYMGKDEKKRYQHFVMDSIVYEWREGRFVKR